MEYLIFKNIQDSQSNVNSTNTIICSMIRNSGTPGSVTDLRDHKWGKHKLHPNDRDKCYYERSSKLNFDNVQLETNLQDNYIKHWKLD